jgi:hypothetical protein
LAAEVAVGTREACGKTLGGQGEVRNRLAAEEYSLLSNAARPAGKPPVMACGKRGWKRGERGRRGEVEDGGKVADEPTGVPQGGGDGRGWRGDGGAGSGVAIDESKVVNLAVLGGAGLEGGSERAVGREQLLNMVGIINPKSKSPKCVGE